MDRIKKDDFSAIAVVFLIAAVLILVSMYVPVAALAAAVVLAYAVARWGTVGIVITAVCFAAGCLLDVKLTAFLSAAMVPLALAAGYVIRKKLCMRHSVIITSGAALLGLAGALGVLWLYTGLGPIDYLVSRFGAYLNTLDDGVVKMVYQYVRLVDMVTGAVTQSAVVSTPVSQAIIVIKDRLRDALNFFLVGEILCYSLLTGLLSYTITRAFVKKRRTVVDVPSFSALTLPPRFWVAYFVSYLLAFGGISFGWPSFDIVTQTIASVYGLVFTVQALSLLDYLYRRRHMATAVRILLHVVLTLFLGFILVWVGMLENMINLRKRLEGGMES